MLKITIPLAKTGILYAWILSFISAFPELSTSVMLRNARTDVVSTALLDVWDGSGGLPQAAAFGSVVFLLVTGLIVLAQKLTGRSLIEKAKN
jgi:ABC-type Fe3+ transport system permease subunit